MLLDDKDEIGLTPSPAWLRSFFTPEATAELNPAILRS